MQIPVARRLSAADNGLLLQEILPEEVIQAIKALNRHKAAGADGLNNDFFQDTQAVMVPALVAIGNDLLTGGEPPTSFLQGWLSHSGKKAIPVTPWTTDLSHYFKQATRSTRK